MATPYDLSGAYPNNPNAGFIQYLNSLGGVNQAQGMQDPWTQLLQSLSPVLTGAYDLGTANLNMGTGREAAGLADPFSGERSQYQTGLRNFMGANPVNPGQVTAGSNNALAMLTNLLQNPSSLTSMPGYQFGLGQALESVNRGAGASGLLNSGNRLAALEDRGNTYAQGWQNQSFNQLLGNVGANNSVAQLGLQAQGQGYGQLAQLAGANTGNPGAAAAALVGGRNAQTANVGSGIGGIANGIGGGLGALQRIIGGGSGGTPWNGSFGTTGGLSPEEGMVGGGGFDAGFPDNWDLMGSGFDNITGLDSLFGAGGVDLGSFL